MSDATRYSVLADTSSLIALANTDHWEKAAESLRITTTTVCKHELQTHIDAATHPPEGSREHYLKRGSKRVLEVIEDDSATFSCVPVVPRPHGTDAGEESLKQELAAHPDTYQIVSLLDTAARRSIRRDVGNRKSDIDVVGPPYLLYILFDINQIPKQDFCDATAAMIQTEGWTGYEVVKAAWEGIPVDCAELLDDEDDDVLPPK